jgi:hypothetical protein
VSDSAAIKATIDAIEKVPNWNDRVTLIRGIPSTYGSGQHRAIYSALAARLYVSSLSSDFAYIHWRDEYDLPEVMRAYDLAYALTGGFSKVDVASLASAIQTEPSTLRIFRLLLGFTTQEFAASTSLVAGPLDLPKLSNGVVKSMENGGRGSVAAARVAAAVVERAIRGELFPSPGGDIRSKIEKPDTADGWETVRKLASDGVPLGVFLHQRHYGGAFRQLLDATSSKRGDLLEQAVEDLFTENGLNFMRTGPSNHALIADKFGLTVKPAPDFLVQDALGNLKAILECKQANDGGTARDKAARFATLRSESIRLGGVPLFAVLAGLGWRRTADTLGPVVRDTDGRVFTVQTLVDMMNVEPFSSLRSQPA